MVTFTLPEELRALFYSQVAKPVYDLFFGAASQALSWSMANPRWLGAQQIGSTMILHTWNQRLLFHPHIHCIVPGAGIDARGKVVTVKSAEFLVYQPALCKAFRAMFHRKLRELAKAGEALPPIDRAVWRKDWGVHIKPFGDGANAIKYLGTYVCRLRLPAPSPFGQCWRIGCLTPPQAFGCRTAIGNSRILAIDAQSVTFSWKDRAHGNAKRTETVSGIEFIRRYLRHVLPEGMRAIRRYGFCHPAAKVKRERVAFHTGAPLVIGPLEPPPQKPVRLCPCCGGEMRAVMRLSASWNHGRDPPTDNLVAA